jgi:hypothetical protein
LSLAALEEMEKIVCRPPDAATDTGNLELVRGFSLPLKMGSSGWKSSPGETRGRIHVRPMIAVLCFKST